MSDCKKLLQEVTLAGTMTIFDCKKLHWLGPINRLFDKWRKGKQNLFSLAKAIVIFRGSNKVVTVMIAIEVASLASYKPGSLCSSSATGQIIVQSQRALVPENRYTYFSDFSLTARLEVTLADV